MLVSSCEVIVQNQTVELNGKQYTALMPRLYLANATLEDLSKTPQAFLSAQNITIKGDFNTFVG
jgi:hypothetical protein